jgi:hypothetical protein
VDGRNAFWDDLARDLKDPEFFEAYVDASLEITARDTCMNSDGPGPDGPGSSWSLSRRRTNG